MNAESLAKALGKAKRSGDSWVCLCPVHENEFSNPSLSIKDGDKGFPVYHCLAGCHWEEVHQELKRKGFIQENNSSNLNGTHEYATVYPYLDIEGNRVADKIKNPGKKFSIKRHISDVPWPLYNLACVAQNSTLYLAEGEKDVETLKKYGLAAVTNIAGASHWQPEHNQYFKDKTVIICQDNDDAGQHRTTKIVANIKTLAKEIRLFAPDGLPEHGDVTDWIAFGGNPKDILEMSKVIHKEEPKVKARICLASDLFVTPPVLPALVIPGFFALGHKMAIFGKSKSRKSYFALQLAICMATGKNFLQFAEPFEKMRVVVFNLEIDNAYFHKRVQEVASGLGIKSPEDLSGLNICHLTGVKTSNMRDEILETMESLKPHVIIIDPLYRLIEGNESDFEAVRELMTDFFNAIRTKYGCSIVYVHHDKKGLVNELDTVSDRGSGSGVTGRDYEAAFALSAHGKDKNLTVIDYDSRHFVPIEPISLSWESYVFIQSSVPVVKLTKNSANRSPDTDKLLDIAIEGIRKKTLLGDVQMNGGQFDDFLDDLIIPKVKWGTIRRKLDASGVITVQQEEHKRGKPISITLLQGAISSNIEAYEEESFPPF